MAVCIKCKERISDEDKFCSKCGHKRETCSCGAFIDYKPHYCSECGEMTHYGLEYYQEILDNKKIELKERKKRIKEFEDEKRNLEERKSLWEGRERGTAENRKKKVAKLAEELGVETGLTLEELKNNFAVKKGYVELILPIECLTIKRIKFVSRPYCFYEAQNLSNWRLPTKDELEIIYKIQHFCKIKELSMSGWIWSDSGDSRAWCLNFDDGNFDKFAKQAGVEANVCLVTDDFEEYKPKQDFSAVYIVE